MKRFIAALTTGLLVGGLVSVVEVDLPAIANGCSLTGIDGTLTNAGESTNPYAVASASNFRNIVECGLDKHYRQTSSFQMDTADGRVSGVFTGVYNGDHYTITLLSPAEDPALRPPPFDELAGVVKKLRLVGDLRALGARDTGLGRMSSLTGFLETSGVISEVGSSVRMEWNGVGLNNRAGSIGGLVGSGRGLVQYSFFTGVVVTNNSAADFDEGFMEIGGLVGKNLAGLWIRDSYSSGSLSFKGSSGSFVVGGVIGDSDMNTPTVVRTYSTTTFEDTCEVNCSATVRVGGLIGRGSGTKTTFVSSFWLGSAANLAIHTLSEGSQPPAYSSDRPVAVPLSATRLQRITTYQSRGNNDDGPYGESEGEFSLPVGASTGSLSANDYRWAIEPDRTTFVAQRRVDTANDNAGVQRIVGETVTFTRAFDRQLWTNSEVPEATYTIRGQAASVTGYPALGRVWEICDGSFPVLVWEEQSCGGDSGSQDTSGTTRDRGSDDPSAVSATGLTGAELEAFLASGLSLEEWSASRLAQTGASAGAVQVGFLASGMVALVGVWLVTWSRRRLRAH